MTATSSVSAGLDTLQEVAPLLAKLPLLQMHVWSMRQLLLLHPWEQHFPRYL